MLKLHSKYGLTTSAATLSFNSHSCPIYLQRSKSQHFSNPHEFSPLVEIHGFLKLLWLPPIGKLDRQGYILQTHSNWHTLFW